MSRLARFLLLLLGAALWLAPTAPGGQPPDNRALGTAAARFDAYLNLTRTLYPARTETGRTVGDRMRVDTRLRDRVEAALRQAPVVVGPKFDDAGIVRVVVELNTLTLPYDLRSGISGLPRSVRVDGLAGEAAAVRAARIHIGSVTEHVKAWAEKDIEAEGDADLDRALQKEQAKKSAQRAALGDAWTALLKKVESLHLDTDVTVKAFVARHPDLRPRLNATVIGARLASERVDRRGVTFTVRVALPGRALLKALKLGGYQVVLGTALSPKQIELARINAYRDAQAGIKDKIYALRFGSGMDAGAFIEKKKHLKAAVDRLCRSVPIERVEIAEDGLIKVTMSVLRRRLPADVRRLLRPDAPRRITTLGAGLPVKPHEPEPEKKPAAGGKE